MISWEVVFGVFPVGSNFRECSAISNVAYWRLLTPCRIWYDAHNSADID